PSTALRPSADGDGRKAVLGLIALVPLAALALYLVVGSPGQPDVPHSERLAQLHEEQRDQTARTADQIARMRATLASDPDNLEAKLLLGSALAQSGALAEAAPLLAEAARAAPDSLAVQSAYAQFLVMARNGQIADDAHGVLVHILGIDPGDARARFFLGLERLQMEDPQGALAIWRDLQADSPADAPWMAMIAENIAQVATEAGIEPQSIPPRHPLALFNDDKQAAEGRTGAPPKPAPVKPNPAAAGAGTVPAAERERIEAMVDGLASRLADQPGDADGWMMLGRSRIVLGQPDAAAEAYGRAVALRPDDLDAKRLQARALLAGAQAKAPSPTKPAPAPPAVFTLMADILAGAPDDREALFFVGLEAAEKGDSERARSLWTRLIAALDPQSDLALELRKRLDALPPA
ncbi:c-type cytochrome biogenesis protein CcmI, partial [Rhodospirillum rubrum]|uniref:tetratricopeptide repeat protein n=1 Tax=Rhodospirillum rubrum TaxID=1085 RepID=UPI001905B585